jgi:hypothetical protein
MQRNEFADCGKGRMGDEKELVMRGATRFYSGSNLLFRETQNFSISGGNRDLRHSPPIYIHPSDHRMRGDAVHPADGEPALYWEMTWYTRGGSERGTGGRR